MEPWLFYAGEVESKESGIHLLPWNRLAVPERLPHDVQGLF
jgi:hypothetical protein